MQEVRNLDHRKVCTVDPKSKTMVIVIKGVETSIAFKPDGTYEVTERRIPA